MTNKIVILENSVELFEHYINDEQWEKALAFPRGGITYLVSNGTIKFFAFEDYLYRNCIISMQLPIHVVDEKRHIDGEYDNINDLVSVLDPIFPSNDIDAELSYYLTIVDAERLYQPIGDYALRSEIPDVSDFITDEDLVDALEDYYTKDEVYNKTEVYAKDEVYTKDEADARFQPIGDYVTLGDYNAYTSTTTTDIENLKVDKLDVTAYTPVDLSNYYTKQEAYNKNETYNRNEIDDKISQSGTFDPTRYYTKDNCDSRFALKNEIPSLSGYATEQWVINKNYATRADFITYINNMQTQINSLIEAVSGCCETQEDVYRWLTIIGEYLCEDNNKYEKQKYQVSHDGGIVWEDVTPIQYRKGQLLESDSEDCGYVPDPQYRWKAAPTSDYMCSGTSKYYKEYYEVSYDSGQTWQHAVPEQTRRGSLIEAQSTDCGYIAPQYRWYTSQREYICSGTTKYEKQYYQVSYDNGNTWENVSPLQTRTGDVIEYNSTDCGYVKVPKLTVSNNSGQTRTIYCNENTTITRQDVPLYDDKGKMMCCISTAVVGDCVKTLSETFWGEHELTSVTLPNTLERIGRLAFSECTSLSSITIPDSVSYLGSGMGGEAFAGCTKLKSIVLPEVYFLNGASFSGCTSLTSVTFNTTNSYIHLGASEFKGCTALEHITIPKLVQIGPAAFMGCTSMQSITFSNISSVPYMEPDENAEYHVFDDSNNCDILVPSNLVASFKSATGWKVFKDRIKAL